VTGVALPGKDRLPPGSHRVFVEALHGLYEGAGKPSLRGIAAAITNNPHFRDTISHEKVGAMLRGDGLPGWLKVECVVLQLAAWHHPPLDPEEVAVRFQKLWLAAGRAREAGDSRPAGAAAQEPAPLASDPMGPTIATTVDGSIPPDLVSDARLPSVVRGRDELIQQILSGRDPGSCPGRPQVLVGAAGMGKSTIAASVAAIARRDGLRHRVWWVSAADEDRLSRDLTSVARDLGVREADWSRMRASPVADLADVADHVWELLEREPSGWLMVIDNADDPGLLGPQDGRGWIRRSSSGLLLVTSRDCDAAHWPGADLVPVGPLRSEDAARVVTDLAPAAVDHAAARALAHRLGYVPMALRLAGMNLRRDLSPSRTFDQYWHDLDHDGTPELSLDNLGRAGFPQARPLLWLLACYAPSSQILEGILTSGRVPGGARVSGTHPLARLLDPGQALPADQLVAYCRTGLRQLQSAGLIDASRSDDGQTCIRVHTLIAEEARAVMDSGLLPPGRPDPALVRASAATAACAFADALDTGSAEDWQYFRILTPHVEELLLHTAAHLPPRGRRDLLTCMVRCIAAHLWSKAERRAEQLSVRAMVLADDLGCHDQDAYLRLRHVHAWARRERGWVDEAAKGFQDILAKQLGSRNGATHLDTLRTRQQLSWTLGRLGRWAEAEEGLREVIRLLDDRQHQQGAEGHDALILRLHTRCMTNWCAGRQGRWAEAEDGYRKLVTDREEVLGPYHPDTLDARFDIGKALAWQGKWSAAENEWRHNAADKAQALGEHHPDTLLARQLRFYADGYQAWQSGDSRARRLAADGLEEVLSRQRETRGDNHRETKETEALLAALRGHYRPDMPWPEDLPRPGAD
jgi:hypothetical protein